MDIQKENDLIQEAFEVEADEIGFCLDQKWGDYENPYENSDTALAFNLFKKGWQAAKAQAVPAQLDVNSILHDIDCYFDNGLSNTERTANNLLQSIYEKLSGEAKSQEPK